MHNGHPNLYQYSYTSLSNFSFASACIDITQLYWILSVGGCLSMLPDPPVWGRLSTTGTSRIIICRGCRAAEWAYLQMWRCRDSLLLTPIQRVLGGAEMSYCIQPSTQTQPLEISPSFLSNLRTMHITGECALSFLSPFSLVEEEVRWRDVIPLALVMPRIDLDSPFSPHRLSLIIHFARCGSDG